MVYLKCIYTKNFGDDLLISILCNRYKKHKFITVNNHKETDFNLCDNLDVIYYNNFLFTLVRRISNIIFKKRCYLETRIIKKCEYVIVIGGSIFMETKNYTKYNRYSLWYQNLNKPYFIIGSNIGPVYTSEYIDEIKSNILNNARDVCLRDKKSYLYVKDMDNVRVSTDIVFSYDVSKYKNIKQNKKVLISVIDVDTKKAQIKNPDSNNYRKKIIELIKKFDGLGYKVELISLCKSEGDENIINSIIDDIVDEVNVKKFFYDGNIDETINEFASSEIIIGTRFHANILGMLLNKVAIPIIYNDKTKNLLKDINFNGKVMDINKLERFNVDALNSDDFNYRCNIEKQILESNKHFEVIDKYL